MDLISRQAAIKEIDSYLLSFTAVDRNYYEGLRDAQRLLHSLPSAEPVRHGKWIYKDNKYVCTGCGVEAERDAKEDFILSNFCQNCGADMRGETDE